MCVNCADFVDICDGEGCLDEAARARGARYGVMRSFYIGDTFCVHMRKKYGHDVATATDAGYQDSA